MDFILKNKKYLIFFSLICLISLLIVFVFLKNINTDQENKEFLKVQIIDSDSGFVKGELRAKIALSPEEHYQGLSFAESLAYDEAMLFIFENYSEREFVMRNMNFSLDILFFNDNKLLNFFENLEPEGQYPSKKYKSDGLSNMVLEVSAGYSAERGIKIGDYLKIINN